MWRSRRQDRTILYSYIGGLAATALVAASLTYLLDPRSGKARRTQLRDRAVNAARHARTFAASTGRDMGQRALFGARARAEDGMLVEKSLHIQADVGEVYSCWRNFENFPQFMSHVREVQKLDDTRSHWSVDGPAGVPVEWDAVITADVPDELIAWRTTEDSKVQSSGVVQFEPSRQGGTRIHVRLHYRPPANLAGHAVARLFRRDPRHQIEADLRRFKGYVEGDRGSRDAQAGAKAAKRGRRTDSRSRKEEAQPGL